MKRTAIVVETKLGIVEYMTLVEALVDGYFDVDGTYQPQIGIVNAMRLFYNNCVKQSDLDGEVSHQFTDIMLVEKLAANDDFIHAFNDAISNKHEYILDFANAFNDARDIIRKQNEQKTSKAVILPAIQAILAEREKNRGD